MQLVTLLHLCPLATRVDLWLHCAPWTGCQSTNGTPRRWEFHPCCGPLSTVGLRPLPAGHQFEGLGTAVTTLGGHDLWGQL